MKDPFLNMNLSQHVSSARQFSELSASIEATQAVVTKANAIKLKGAEAQIESSKILAEHREKLEVMRSSIHELLKHTLEQAEQNEMMSREREKLETARYRENLRFTKIAAWTGVIGILIGLVSIVIQYFH